MSMSMSMSSSYSRMSVKNAVEECGKKFGFNVEEALIFLNIKKDKKEKVEKSKYPLPFNGSKKENCCNGIVKNHGLYTQCEKKVKENDYCKGCESQPYGNITSRLSVDLYEYKDPKGKIPKRYTEVLKKLKLSKETIEEEAKRLNITINPIHFEEVAENVKRGRPKTEKKVKEQTGKKGRPKKAKKVVEVNNNNEEEEDLFATLIANAHQPLKKVEPNSLQPLKKVEPNSVEEVVTAMTEEALEEAVEEAVEEAKDVPLPKAEKKAKKVKEVDPVKEAEKLKKAVEKAAKEAEKLKKAEEKAAKEAEKQKKAEEKATKEAEKQKKAEEKQKKAEEKAEKEEEADVVKKIEFEGKPYYKSNKSGVIYNMEQEVVGKWNEERKAIDFEEEEEEEEYDD